MGDKHERDDKEHPATDPRPDTEAADTADGPEQPPPTDPGVIPNPKNPPPPQRP